MFVRFRKHEGIDLSAIERGCRWLRTTVSDFCVKSRCKDAACGACSFDIQNVFPIERFLGNSLEQSLALDPMSLVVVMGAKSGFQAEYF